MKPVSFYGASDLGRIRTNNEDDFIAQYIWDKSHVLAVVIDGVGGYEGGEVAAALAHATIVEYLENYPDGERLELLKQAVISANNKINMERELQPEYSHMSCVLTAVLIELEARRINMAHVGDTRLYEYAEGILSKLSHDHSLVGYREEIGDLTEEQAMRHPQRNIISRDVGSSVLDTGTKDYIETAVFPLLADSSLMLCSDGLCDMVTSAQMTEVFRAGRSAEDKVHELIALANEAGGKDNVTVVVVDIELDDKKEAPVAAAIEKIPVKKKKTKKPTKAVKTSRQGEETALKPAVIERQPLRVHDDYDEEEERFEESEPRETKNNNNRTVWIVGLLMLVIGFFIGAFTWNPLADPVIIEVPVQDTAVTLPPVDTGEIFLDTMGVDSSVSEEVTDGELNNDGQKPSNNSATLETNPGATTVNPEQKRPQ